MLKTYLSRAEQIIGKRSPAEIAHDDAVVAGLEMGLPIEFEDQNMRALTIILIAALATSCSNGTARHLAKTKREVAAIGATNIVADAFALMAAYESPGHGEHPFITVHGIANSLAAFSSTADVKPTMVSITTAGLGAHRGGIIVTKDESDRFLDTNTCTKIADNIFHFAY